LKQDVSDETGIDSRTKNPTVEIEARNQREVERLSEACPPVFGRG
jgi:hypothetical protein